MKTDNLPDFIAISLNIELVFRINNLVLQKIIGRPTEQINMKKNNKINMISRLLSAILLFSFSGNYLQSQNYKVVDGGQTKCFNTTGSITSPSAGQSLYGQDAAYTGNTSSYTLSSDTKTVYDNITGLTWMSSPNMTNTAPVKTDRMSYSAAQSWVSTVNAANFGGFNDWRIPTIKELYSLYLAKGIDPGGSTSSAGLTPFLDDTYFKFAYGNTSIGERLIDQQYLSSNIFILNPSESGYTKDFGVNFSDGRIKGYDMVDALSKLTKTFYVQLVRGKTNYGINNFVDNGNQTITDNETKLMWAKNDNGSGLNWTDALAWVQTKNSQNYLGHNDWRMPDIKELQSIIDYSHSPDYDNSPAINTSYFNCTPTINEAGQSDWGYYWSSTTHESYTTTNGGGAEADYIPFGRALGWPSTQTKWVDVHGAGCQRSDQKIGPPYSWAILKTTIVNAVTYTGYSFGPQGDAIRGANYVRIVRTISGSTEIFNTSSSANEYKPTENSFYQTIIIQNTTGAENYQLVNVMGQTVWVGNQIEKQNFVHLTSGIYFLNIANQKNIQTIKLLKN